MSKTKIFPARVKAAGVEDGLELGQFEAVVSVFDNVDSYGDVVMPGAFAKTLEAWAVKGDPIPVIWSHRWDDPEMHVGWVMEAEERAEGLWVRGQIDLDSDATPKAKQVNRLLKGRRVTQFSFAYDVIDGGYGKRDDKDVYELRELDLHEVGPCLIGVNRETELLAAKSSDAVGVVSADEVSPWLALVDYAKATGTLGELEAAIAKVSDDGPTGDAGPVVVDDEQADQASDAASDPDGPTLMSPASALLHADVIES